MLSTRFEIYVRIFSIEGNRRLKNVCRVGIEICLYNLSLFDNIYQNGFYSRQESRIRDRFCHRRELDENSRDFYYNPQNVMRLNRNSKDGTKVWPRKHEERDHPHANEHQSILERIFSKIVAFCLET